MPQMCLEFSPGDVARILRSIFGGFEDDETNDIEDSQLVNKTLTSKISQGTKKGKQG